MSNVDVTETTYTVEVIDESIDTTVVVSGSAGYDVVVTDASELTVGHLSNINNPHDVTAEQVGLGNVIDAEQLLRSQLEATLTPTASGSVPSSKAVADYITADLLINKINNSAGIIADNNIASTIARDSEVSGSIASAISNLSVQGHTHSASAVTDFDAEVGNHTDVAANTSARHSHTNAAALAAITDAGSGVVISAAERTKLAGIETGATADMTAAEILTAIKTVDGTASGLDSDLLDAQEGSYYRNANNLNAGTVAAARLSTAPAAYTIDPTYAKTATGHYGIGNATIGELAYNKAYVGNKTIFMTPYSIEYTLDGTTWLPYTAYAVDSNTVKNLFLGRYNAYALPIPGPNNGNYAGLRFTLRSPTYVSLEYFYYYAYANGHTLTTKLERSTLDDINTWTTIATHNGFNAWPGHCTIAHPQVLWYNYQNVPPSGRSTYVRITFTPKWNAGYPNNNINIQNISWYGEYPANTEADIYSYDNAKNVTFVGTLTANGQEVVLTNDSRLSDARTPVSHTHGNVTNAGAIGSTANLPVITTTSGVLTTGTFGTGANTFCQGNDSRLSNARTPTSHASTHLSNGADAIASATTSVGGLMSAADKTKLDAIESGATADLTGSEIITLINGAADTIDDDNIASTLSRTSHVHGNVTAAGAIGSTANLPVITTTSGVLTTGSFGSAANTFCQGNDSRLSDARTPLSHTHGNITNSGYLGSTANLPLITGTAGIVQAGSFGTGANTFCQGNDSRLSDARTPVSHVHGNITNAGAIGTTTNLPIITTTSGVLTTGSFGTGANTFCVGNDARLSDSRTPTAHAASHLGGSDSLGLGTAAFKAAGSANGVAELDATGKVPSAQLPSFVDDVVESADYASLPVTGETGKIYVTLDTNKTYRWSGSAYAEISASLALGETSTTAYRGDRGATAYSHAIATGNAHNLTASDIVGIINAGASLIDDDNIASTIARDSEVTSAISTHAGNATAHHSNANDPTSGQKAALAGTSGTVSDSNRYVTNADSRMTDARTPLSHAHGNITNTGYLGSTASLPLITGTAGIIQAGSFGSSAGTFCQGNDSRLSDARTPVSHTHGNITNTGAIGSTANLPIITTTSGVLTVGSFGSSANTFCVGNDARLSDARTPLSHSHTYSDISSLVTTVTNDDTKIPTAGAVYDLDATALHKAITNEIHGMTNKVALAASDVFVIEDSSASYGKKYVTYSAFMDTNIDGGSPSSIYQVSQLIDGGTV